MDKTRQQLEQEELLRKLRSQTPQSYYQQPTPPGDISAIGPIVLIVSSLLFVVAFLSFGGNFPIGHQVPEGHVGVYWRGGALMKTITDPGFHLMLPRVNKFKPIQVTLQTDLVTDIPCGTKGGVMISFGKVEVVYRLRKDFVYDTLLNYGMHYNKTWIYDNIHHKINQFCSAHSLQQVYIDMFDQIDDKMKEAIQRDCTQYAPGIEIIGVRVTKPNIIPSSIKKYFELVEVEHIKALLAIEKQKVAEYEAETHKTIASKCFNLIFEHLNFSFAFAF